MRNAEEAFVEQVDNRLDTQKEDLWYIIVPPADSLRMHVTSTEIISN